MGERWERRQTGEATEVEEWIVERDSYDGAGDQDEDLEDGESEEPDDDDAEEEEEEEDADEDEDEDEDKDEDESYDDEEEEDDAVARSPDERLRRVLSRLSFAVPDGCRIRVVPRNDVNGWTDGETVTITSRAAEELPEGALAALVAHELAHVRMRHVQQNRALAEAVLGSFVGVWRASGAGLGEKIVTTVAAAGASFVGSRLYRKLQELSADAGALDLLRQGGYTADDARELEQRLEGEGGLLSTHPSQETRLRWLDLLDDE